MTGDLVLTEDIQLQERLKEGDEAAFRSLFNKYWERLFSYAFRIYEEEKICEDIVQEIFIRLWERREGPQILNLEGYLFRSVKYAIANHFRDLKFTKVHLEALDKIGVQDSAQKRLEYQELETYTLALIDGLPEKCRLVFKLSRMEHLSNQEIAEKLQISLRTVETHISNALKYLRTHMPESRISTLLGILLLYR